ncbi:hypothetical protein FJY90_02895 [Candidatus Gottesmanbacteria bacterium]|nr:hypothetical protein [Candidatus Gottesmanbacteria bacterium]
MASQTKSPSTVVDDASIGTISWANPENAKVSDDNRAIATWSGAAISHYLKATNFGFTIPTNAIILGIVIEKEGYFNGSGWGSSCARLVKAGSVVGDIKIKNFAGPPDAYYSQGLSTSLWGVSWTPADINSENFGVALYTDMGDPASSCTVNIDHIRITVYYTSGYTIRVSKTGYDCLSEGNIYNYLLFADTDNILIKEKARGTGTVNLYSTATIAHDLGYIPFYLAYCEVASNRYRIATAFNPLGSGWRAYADTSNLYVYNGYSSTYKSYRHYIFYDNMS